MSKPHLIHGAWALVAIGAFALGSLRRSDEGDRRADSAGEPGGSGRGTISGLSTGSSRDGNASTERAPGGVGRAAGGGIAAPGRGLDSGEVESLATRAFKDPNPLNRSIAFNRLLEGLTAENAEAILESLEEHAADRGDWTLFLYAWGSKDAPGAMAYALANLEGERLDRFQRSVLTGWASSDPQAAIAWARQQTGDDGATPENINYALIAGLADSDIGVATDYALQLADEGDGNAARYLETIGREQMRSAGLSDTITWAEALPDGAAKASALDRVARTYVDRDPEAAASWAEKFAGESWAARVIEEIGDEWAERDPQASVAWLATLPQGDGRNEGTYSAFREWAQRDAMAASEHLVKMPGSADRDHAVHGLSRTIASKEPRSAITWAETITDPELRTEALTRVGQTWYQNDRTAAAEWLATSGLPPEAQKQVTTPPERSWR